MAIKYNLQNLEKIKKELDYLSDKKIRVGVIGNETVEGTKVKTYAIYNEYGTIRIPARPFFRTALVFQQGHDAVLNKVNETVLMVAKGELTGEQGLNKIGLYCKDRVVVSLLHGEWVKNALSTLSQKPSTKPLVSTGTLVRNIDYEVV